MQIFFWLSSAAYCLYYAYTGALLLMLGNVFDEPLRGSEIEFYNRSLTTMGYVDFAISVACIVGMVLHAMKKPLGARIWMATLAFVVFYEVTFVVIDLESITLARDLVVAIVALWVFLRGLLGWRRLSG